MRNAYQTPFEMTTFYQGLADHHWKVVAVDLAAGDEVKMDDILQFTPDMKIERTDSWKSGDWAASCFVAPDGLRGATLSDNRPFLIQLDPVDPSTGTCVFFQSTAQRTFPAVALGTAAGAVVGAVAGMLGGSWVAGALTGVAAGLAGSLAVAARLHSADTVSTGSTATLTVDDGSHGREIEASTAHAARA